MSARVGHADRQSLVDGTQVKGSIPIRYIGRVIDREQCGISGTLIPTSDRPILGRKQKGCRLFVRSA